MRPVIPFNHSSLFWSIPSLINAEIGKFSASKGAVPVSAANVVAKLSRSSSLKTQAITIHSERFSDVIVRGLNLESFTQSKANA